MDRLGVVYLTTVIPRFLYYKELGEKTFEQLTDSDFHYQANGESNSIAMIIQHLKGNMLSRWTNFLTEDGEKEWRERDEEFNVHASSKEDLLNQWQDGWHCFISTLESLKEEDLLKTISIREEKMLVVDAINRQLAHYPYHVGQILYIGKLILNNAWKNLSIPKGGSIKFNQGSQPRDPGKHK